MILPTTYSAALLLTIVTMLCWGSWANTYKLSGKWRFELFYFDYAIGVMILGVIAAFTFGSMGEEGLAVMDNFAVSGKRQMAFGFLGGVVFNLANMLLVAAISVSGMAVAFPVGIGLALVVGVVWNYMLNAQGNPTLLFTGVALVALAIIVDAIAYGVHGATKKASTEPEPAPAAAVQAAPTSGPAARRHVTKAKPKGPGVVTGLILSLVSGALMGSFYPLVELGKAGEIGLGPYAIGLVFAAGVLISTPFFNLYFMNLPVQGDPVEFKDYFRGSGKQHLLGLLGGIVWMIGTVSNFAASSAPHDVQVGPAVSYAIGQGATLISALWGLLVWREFAGATPKVKGLLALMLALFVAGLGLVSIAPLYARR